MDNKKQKDIFLSSEGDQWFFRNKEDTDNYVPKNDPLLIKIKSFIPKLLIIISA